MGHGRGGPALGELTCPAPAALRADRGARPHWRAVPAKGSSVLLERQAQAEPRRDAEDGEHDGHGRDGLALGKLTRPAPEAPKGPRGGDAPAREAAAPKEGSSTLLSMTEATQPADPTEREHDAQQEEPGAGSQRGAADSAAGTRGPRAGAATRRQASGDRGAARRGGVRGPTAGRKEMWGHQGPTSLSSMTDDPNVA